VSHVGNVAVVVTWPRCDVYAESCWRWHCRDDVGRSTVLMLSHADNVAVVTTWPWRDVDPNNHANMIFSLIYTRRVMILIDSNSATRRVQDRIFDVTDHAGDDVVESVLVLA
jgi:hypothetical protein